MTGHGRDHQHRRPGDIMNTTLTAIGSTPGTDRADRSRRADARLAPGGRGHPLQRDTRAAPRPRLGEAARWQHILDLLDPGKRCGEWSSATFEGRPVVCTRVPHDAREAHANAETGWRWRDETS
jgi:hypothetical protein